MNQIRFFTAFFATIACGQMTYGASYEQIRSFGPAEISPSNPQGELIVATDGWLYGCTSAGGSNGVGLLFKIAHSGAGYQELKHFGASGNDAKSPYGRLLEASDGFLYGTTKSGGTNNYGTVFRIAKGGAGFQVLRHLSYSEGGSPQSGLIESTNGYLYGTTSQGGNNGSGTAFLMSKDGSSNQVIHSFPAPNVNGYSVYDGQQPLGALLLGSDGMLYGTTAVGGSHGYGIAFKMAQNGSNYFVLTSLQGMPGLMGREIHAPMVEGKDGSLYTCSVYGGEYDVGAVFRVPKAGDYYGIGEFNNTRGSYPSGKLRQLSDGMLYGTATGGGAGGYGVVFKLSTNGGDFSLPTVLTNYSGAPFDGQSPIGGVTEGTNGLLYVLSSDRINGTMIMTSLAKDGSGFQQVKSFPSTKDGNSPNLGMQGSDGFLYGTTYFGGSNDVGTVFRINLDGNGYQVLRQFVYNSVDARYPSVLVEATNGVLYGTTETGGTNGGGSIFRLNKDGSGYQAISIPAPLSAPKAGLLQASSGQLYGTTYRGGSNNLGTVFRINADGSGLQIVKYFDSANGWGPSAPLIELHGGVLIGTTESGGSNNYGTVFRLNLDGSGFQALKHFSGLDGRNPRSALVEGGDGFLYGTTYNGGSNNNGTIFRLNQDGSAFQVVIHLSGSTGYHPSFAPVRFGSRLFGTAQGGTNVGVAYELNLNSLNLRIVNDFANAPAPGLIAGSDGFLYGATAGGGNFGLGTLYRISLPLRDGDQRSGVLTNQDPVSLNSLYDPYDLDLLSSGFNEHAAYLQSGSNFTPVIKLFDPLSATMLATNVGLSGECLLLLTNAPGSNYAIQVTSLETNKTGSYRVALYAVIRPGSTNYRSLDADDVPDTFRSNGVYYADDYLLQRANESVRVWVEATNFTPQLWLWDLTSAGTNRTAYPGVGSLANGVLGVETLSRTWVLRVSSTGAKVTGAYRLWLESLGGGAAVTDFNPSMGRPGQLVKIATANLNVTNNLASVSFGGVASSDYYYDLGLNKVLAAVPLGARSGKITVSDGNASPQSAQDFVVLSALGALLRGPGNSFSFGISNATGGLTNLLEAATNLNPPVTWQPLWTNVAAGPGLWRYTNQNNSLFPQRFFRARVQ